MKSRYIRVYSLAACGRAVDFRNADVGENEKIAREKPTPLCLPSWFVGQGKRGVLQMEFREVEFWSIHEIDAQSAASGLRTS